MIGLPEFEREYVGKVGLAYIDPPFNTQQSFLHYDDALEHSVWLTMMRDRLNAIKTLLSPTGSVWVHCDDSEQAYLKVMMDEVFGRDSFISTIVWQKRTTRENRATFSQSQDYILVYALAGLNWKSSRNMLAHNGASFANPDNDPRGLWTSVSLSAQGYRPNQMYTIVSPSGIEHKPPKGGCWKIIESNYRALLADNRIYFPKNGEGKPRRKTFLSELEGLVPMTLWTAEEVGTNDMAKREIMSMFPDEEAFATPKPEPLLERIIHIASKPGDIVLDCFLGSGTTAAVAHKMGRRWIGVESNSDTVNRYAIPRLTKVVEGRDPGGITEAAGWEGGGSFRVLDVAPSMFVEDRGQVFLSEWAVNGELTEATAAQLHYDYVYDPPFCGRRGRSRLAVIDGLVNEAVVQFLVSALVFPHG